MRDRLESDFELGWYKRSKFLLEEKLVEARIKLLDEIIAMITGTINTLTTKAKA